MASLTTFQIFLLTITNIFNYLDRYLLNSILPLIKEDFGLSHSQTGMLAGSFAIGYVIFSPIFGYLGDRFPRPILLVIGVSLWGLATLGTGLSQGFFALLATRILVGVGEASYGTIAPGYIKDFEVEPSKVNRTLSIFYSAIPVGSALGFVTGGLIADQFGWHTVFFIGAICTVVLVPFLLRLKEHESRTSPQAVCIKTGLRSISASRIIVFSILGYILNSFALNGIAAFVAGYGVSLGFELSSINSLFGAILVITGLLGTLVGARIGNWYAKRFFVGGGKDFSLGLLQFIGIASCLAAPILAVTFLVEDRVLFISLCAVAELVIFFTTAPVNAVLVNDAPKGYMALTQGVTIVAINLLGAFLGPQVVGILADVVGLKLALQITSLAALFSGFIWILGSIGRSPMRE